MINNAATCNTGVSVVNKKEKKAILWHTSGEETPTINPPCQQEIGKNCRETPPNPV